MMPKPRKAIHERDHREDDQDAQHDIDDHGLGPGHQPRPDDVHRRHHDDDQRREDFGPGGVLARERGAGVATERDRHHRGHDGVGRVGQPRGDPGEMAVAEPLGHVFEQAAGRRIAGAEFRERIALQERDGPGEQEGQPHRRPGHRPGRAEQGEDSRTDHAADTDECGLLDGQVLVRGGRLGLSLAHLDFAPRSCRPCPRRSRRCRRASRWPPAGRSWPRSARRPRPWAP